METDKYTFKRRRGIDDLLSEYAFIGNSQGDESRSNDIIDYKSAKGWLSFIFEGVDKEDQQAIYNEVEGRKKENLDYVDKLYKEGRYGEEYEISIEMVHNPLYDEPSLFKPNLESSRIIFLDFNKDDNDTVKKD